jgi:hypothetical protein
MPKCEISDLFDFHVFTPQGLSEWTEIRKKIFLIFGAVCAF